MAINDSGFNTTAAESAIKNIISGGANIHLLTSEGSATDTSTEISNKSGKSISMAEADFNVVAAVDFTDTNKLELASDANFGATSVGVVYDIAIVSGDDAIIANETNTPDLTGEDYTIPSGEVLFEVGNA